MRSVPGLAFAAEVGAAAFELSPVDLAPIVTFLQDVERNLTRTVHRGRVGAGLAAGELPPEIDGEHHGPRQEQGVHQDDAGHHKEVENRGHGLLTTDRTEHVLTLADDEDAERGRWTKVRAEHHDVPSGAPVATETGCWSHQQFMVNGSFRPQSWKDFAALSAGIFPRATSDSPFVAATASPSETIAEPGSAVHRAGGHRSAGGAGGRRMAGPVLAQPGIMTGMGQDRFARYDRSPAFSWTLARSVELELEEIGVVTTG